MSLGKACFSFKYKRFVRIKLCDLHVLVKKTSIDVKHLEQVRMKEKMLDANECFNIGKKPNFDSNILNHYGIYLL